MIRLTVLYNLPEGTNEDEFLSWRLGEHQDSNSKIGGVIRTDFGRIDEAWPREQSAPYRFMTVVEWPDRESFEAGFYAPNVQEKLRGDIERISDMVFLVSEVLTETKKVE